MFYNKIINIIKYIKARELIFIGFYYSKLIYFGNSDRFKNYLKMIFGKQPCTVLYYNSARTAIFDYLQNLHSIKSLNILIVNGTCVAVPSAVEKSGHQFFTVGKANEILSISEIREKIIENNISVVIIQTQFGSDIIPNINILRSEFQTRFILDSSLTCILEFQDRKILEQFEAIILSFDSSKPIPLGYGGVLLSFKEPFRTNLRPSFLNFTLYFLANNIQCLFGKLLFLRINQRLALVEIFSILKSKLFKHFLRNDLIGSPMPIYYRDRFPAIFGEVLFNAHLQYVNEKQKRYTYRDKIIELLSARKYKIFGGYERRLSWDPLRIPVQIDSRCWDRLPIEIRSMFWFNCQFIGDINSVDKCDNSLRIANLPRCVTEADYKRVKIFIEKYL